MSSIVSATFNRRNGESIIFRILGSVCLLLMHIFLGRVLGGDGYGVFSYTITIAGLLSVIVSLGWPIAMIRFIAEYGKESHLPLLKGSFIAAFYVPLAASLLGSLMLVGIALAFPFTAPTATSLLFAAAILPFASIAAVRRNVLLGLSRIWESTIPDDILLPLTVIALVFAFGVNEPVGSLWVYLFGSVLALIAGGVFIRRALPMKFQGVVPEYRIRAWMAIAVPMMFGSLSQLVLNRTDIIMIGAFVDMEAVGLYSAAARITLMVVFILNAVAVGCASMLALAYQTGQRDQFKTIYGKAMLWSTLAALPLTLLIMAAPEFLMQFFGGEFQGGASLIRVLAFGQMVNAMTGPVGHALMLTKQEKTYSWSISAMALANVIGNALVVPVYGAIGAAYVTAGCLVVLNSAQLFFLMSSQRVELKG